MKPDNDRVMNLLNNWRVWSLDMPPDPAEVPYYTVCPDFAGIVKRRSSSRVADNESAWIVEVVMREVYRESRPTWNLIRKYYLRQYEDTADHIAEEIGIHRATLFRRLNIARDIFAVEWERLARIALTNR